MACNLTWGSMWCGVGGDVVLQEVMWCGMGGDVVLQSGVVWEIVVWCGRVVWCGKEEV